MSKNLVIFTGAGFTKGVWNDAPLATDLLKRIFAEFDQFAKDGNQEAIDVCNEVLETFFKGVKNKESVNIELLLGLLYRLEHTATDASLKHRASALWEWLNVALGRVVHYSLPITKTLTPAPMSFLYKILKACKENFQRTSIVTTNYDLIVDKINHLNIDHDLGYGEYYTDRNKKGKLPPDIRRYQYGVPINAVFRVEMNVNNPSKLETVIDNTSCKQWQDIPEMIHVYKLHGSVNWACCKSCKEEIHLAARRSDLNHIFNIEDIRCVYHDKPYKRVIIPPMAVKQQAREHMALSKIWDEAEAVLSDADIVLFIGYSLPIQDPYVVELIIRSRAMARMRNHDWSYWVIDPIKEVHDRYEQTFGKSKLNIIQHFDPVIFYSQYLPELINMA